MLIGAPLAVAAALANVVVKDPAASRTLHLAFGVGAAATLCLAALLGLRKRMLRLRIGSVAAWTSAHNWLGGLSLFFALLHARFQLGGALSGALLGLLLLSVLTGGIGIAVQSVVPRLMTSRLPDESPSDDPKPVFAAHWRSVHEIVASACGVRPEVEDELRSLEKACGIRQAWPSKPRAMDSVMPLSIEGQAILGDFYRQKLVPFLRSPLSRKAKLANEADATLAFEALRGGVHPVFHDAIERIREICGEARYRAEEVRLRRFLEGWVLVHIPIAMMAFTLMIAHAFSALYY